MTTYGGLCNIAMYNTTRTANQIKAMQMSNFTERMFLGSFITKQSKIRRSSSEDCPSLAFISANKGYTIDQGDNLASMISRPSNCFLTASLG